MSDIEPIQVEVAYALPDKQKIVELLVEPGTTAYIAVQKSKIADYFPQTLGTKGSKPAKEHILQAGDRVEIYRPLIADPKEVRRKRAEKAKLVAE